jgi:hypothetical protein
LIGSDWEWLDFLEQIPKNKINATSELSSKLLCYKDTVNTLFKTFMSNLASSMPASAVFIGGIEEESSSVEKLIFKFSDDLKSFPLTVKSPAFRSYNADFRAIYNEIPKCEKVFLLCTPEFKSQCADMRSGPHMQVRLIDHFHKTNSIFALIIEGSAGEALPQNLLINAENIGTKSGYYQDLLWLVAKIQGRDFQELKNAFIKCVNAHIPETVCMAEIIPLESAEARVMVEEQPQNLDQAKVKEASEVEIPRSYLCCITQEMMQDPVVDHEGHSYEREAIVAWIKKSGTSPMTRQPLVLADLIPNRALKDAIEEFGKSLNKG